MALKAIVQLTKKFGVVNVNFFASTPPPPPPPERQLLLTFQYPLLPVNG